MWQLDHEAVAREVMALELPSIVRILHVGSGLVFARPPPVSQRPLLSLAAAATCALEACEVIAWMLGIGHAELHYGPRHLRLVERDGAWGIAWLIPGFDALDTLDSGDGEVTEEQIAALFADDTIPDAPAIVSAAQQIARLFLALRPDVPSRAGGPEIEAALAAISRIERGEVVADVVALAWVLVPLVAEPAVWERRIAAFPAAGGASVRRHDWDAIVRRRGRRVKSRTETMPGRTRRQGYSRCTTAISRSRNGSSGGRSRGCRRRRAPMRWGMCCIAAGRSRRR